jgi:hypothetical protein
LLQPPRLHFDAAGLKREEQAVVSTAEGLGAVAGGGNPLVGGQCFFLETPRVLQPPRLHFDSAVLKREEQAEVSTAEGLGAVAGGANLLIGSQYFFLETP